MGRSRRPAYGQSGICVASWQIRAARQAGPSITCIAISPDPRRTGAGLPTSITVIPSFDLCGEYVKTKGHYHPADPAGTGYPELYDVTEGRALFLIQSRTLDDVILISAETGARVVIPPGYGHITINPSPDATLVLANLVSTAFESEY